MNNLSMPTVVEHFGVNIFGGIIDPIFAIARGFIGIGKIISQIAEIFFYVMKLIPLIFDPPKLIDDVIFAISHSINTIIGKIGNNFDASKPEDQKDDKDSGPFGVNKRDRNPICIQPTIAMLLMLIICPPLAIFYKLNFWKGFIPSIICGVLCVKLYYFPGLLFAALMVLC